MFFRELSEEERVEFCRWARENYQRGTPIQGVWHPVVQAECVKMNEEADEVDQRITEEKNNLLDY